MKPLYKIEHTMTILVLCYEKVQIRVVAASFRPSSPVIYGTGSEEGEEDMLLMCTVPPAAFTLWQVL